LIPFPRESKGLESILVFVNSHTLTLVAQLSLLGKTRFGLSIVILETSSQLRGGKATMILT
jgi:hypothetical protein